jgi:hypothetical protein
MKKYAFLVVLFLSIGIMKGVGQVKLMPNFVCSKQFETAKDIYSTFTQGVVHYQAEIMYIYGEVFVTAHMPDSSSHNLPTIRSAYLMPIYSQYKKNMGKVQENFNDEMYLFLDIKFDPKKTYLKLWEELNPYSEILTYRKGNEWHEGKLKIVFVGNAPMRLFQQERVCFATAQGTVDDLSKNYDNKVMPLIGIDFSKELNWDGVGKMPFDQFIKFKEILKKAHDQGKKVRIVNCPDEENIWEVLLTSGVDMITSADPERFNKFLAARGNK